MKAATALIAACAVAATARAVYWMLGCRRAEAARDRAFDRVDELGRDLRATRRERDRACAVVVAAAAGRAEPRHVAWARAVLASAAGAPASTL